ncbi:unnamed protein product [Tilletia controversa]|uniref:Protein kinase domain-containing protein n=3 Tax=Tilletia TaxID=13289 RepID=A0A8X7MMQ5_9BASI|nr:hypothetical protein CF336_g5832 [Tilletia laevis]KAE8190702.1 hypothetical protein CF328_g5894 [Tilletia controversa]KAE8249452.1 hypothetical protein A4X03_0g6608 [Tilletia caries]KAE8193252.1 hypothetical protein CF335_g5638 [Tilletia laevis]KAE8242275.1 hypothetical protein A4X06_0g7060 [Tilletia controversa]
MPTYQDLSKQPFSQLSSSDVAAIRTYGKRQCWPDETYNFNTIPNQLLHDPQVHALFNSILDVQDSFAQEQVVDVRGAGPYGPRGARILFWVAYSRLKTLKPSCPPNLLQCMARSAITDLAVLLLKADTEAETSMARRAIYDGAFYGLVIFPSQLTPPSSSTSPQGPKSSPSTSLLHPSPAPTANPGPKIEDEPRQPSPPPRAHESWRVSATPSLPSYDEMYTPMEEDAEPVVRSVPPVDASVPTRQTEFSFRSPISLNRAVPRRTTPFSLFRLNPSLEHCINTDRSVQVQPRFGSPSRPIGTDWSVKVEKGTQTVEQLQAEEDNKPESPVQVEAQTQTESLSPQKGVWVRKDRPRGAGDDPFEAPDYYQSFNRYEQGNQISGGTQGQIFKSVDRLSGFTVAVKLARCDDNGRPPNTMLREIHMLRRCQHRNILFLQAVLYNRVNLGIVLGLARQDLKTAIVRKRPGALDASIAKLYLRQILDGLKYLHEKVPGLHLDLKPENILLNADHRLRIADFGLSREPGPARAQRTVITMPYRPPEIFFRTSHFTYAADMFSVGAIVAEMVGGYLPWSQLAINPLTCFNGMLDFLGCGTGELWPGADNLTGVWDGDDAVADYYLTTKGCCRFSPRGRRMDKLPCTMHDAGDLVDIRDKLLVLNPASRSPAKHLLYHCAFSNEPLPAHHGTEPAVAEHYRVYV